MPANFWSRTLGPPAMAWLLAWTLAPGRPDPALGNESDLVVHVAMFVVWQLQLFPPDEDFPCPLSRPVPSPAPVTHSRIQSA
jgi:hypothetical protein